MGSAHPIDRMVKELCDWAFADSSVQLDRRRLREGLTADSVASGRVLTDTECELLICGFEGDPVLEALRAVFPKTQQFLQENWA